MKDLKSRIEGKMDESYFYEILRKNMIISLVGVGVIFAMMYAVYNGLIPMMQTLLPMATNLSILFVIMLVASYFIFIHIFRVDEPLERIIWILASIAYVSLLYLLGEAIIIAILIFGIFITLTAIFGEISFTSILTYIDLKEWAEAEESQKHIEEKVKDYN